VACQNEFEKYPDNNKEWNNKFMTKMENAAQTVINKSLNAQKGESILILYNSPHEQVAQYLFSAASKKSNNSFLLQISQIPKQDPIPFVLEQFMCKMDVIVAVTSPSISHTNARRKACRKGSRIISMPNITDDTFSRLASADYSKIKRKSRKLKDILSMAKEAVVTAPNGTELYIPINIHKGYADLGILYKAGSFSNLPAGEASIAPDEGKTEGRLIVDSGMGVSPNDTNKLILSIKNGKTTRISGGSAADRLRRRLSYYGPQSRLIAEFGIGTNDSAKLSGYSLEDEKVLGTIHVAIGNNISFGGNNDVPIHLDGVAYNATVEIDGRKILEKGKYVLE
jgi:leucyl aminopeptidase (aminopeptidase T)